MASVLIVRAFLLTFMVFAVTGLHCPVCHRVGQYGSQECEVVRCNSQKYVRHADEVRAALIEQVNQQMDQEFNESTVYAIDGSLSPVCMKALGTFDLSDSDSSAGQVHYAIAACVSRGGSWPPFDIPCELFLEPLNNFTVAWSVPQTRDMICYCDRANEEDCEMSEEDLDGTTVKVLQRHRLGKTRVVSLVVATNATSAVHKINILNCAGGQWPLALFITFLALIIH